MKSLLVRIFGFPATLIHGDTLVLDRWLWLRKQLPVVRIGAKSLLDVGCGTGSFTMGAALRGYSALGLSWDERNQSVARSRAAICGATLADFAVQDVRYLDQRSDLIGKFDVVVCCENIEHILNDRKLMIDMAHCLQSGGTLLLTTPNFHFRPITKGDDGPYLEIENGAHVRRGYTEEVLRNLCASAGLRVEQIGYCSGFMSQKVTALMRTGSRIHPMLGWILILPLRVLPLLFDPWIARATHWPGFSITLIAKKS